MTTTMILIALGALLIGLLIGYFVAAGSRSNTRPRERRLQQQMDELRNEHTRYQADVNAHFMESAQLLRRLNDVQRDLQQQMARSASRLSSDEESQQALVFEGKSHRDRSLPDDDSIEPPRDYAPKDSPDEQGTLSEAYGFKPAPKGSKSPEKKDKA
ncbi:YhcB family protein [Mangrovitalea sediminis]|uniref:YhcB family protein n=1 Tax=Mangrovitalea sediminis TaxID=1982043 RepID=UPI000BE4D280|nr:DUF1043 family protein [Mangrovitalea sediminis]